MSDETTGDSAEWVPTWTQAMTDFRGEADERPLDDVTVRLTVPASIGGRHVRIELSNRFGDETVRIGRAAVGTGDRFVELAFDRERSIDVPAGESCWSDPVEMAVEHGDDLVVDLHLPDPTPYATAGGFSFDRSEPGDFVGSDEFPVEGSRAETPHPRPGASGSTDTEPDGNDWSLPAGGPFLRSVEVAGAQARAVIVALGSSSTAMGWPQYAAGLLPAEARVAVLNRGISGNRIRLDGSSSDAARGRSGLSRFDEDVLGTHGVTHVVIAYSNNDWTLPGLSTPEEEMPTVDQMIGAYQELVDRARAAGTGVILATIIPLSPDFSADTHRQDIRRGLNAWIRSSSHELVDFDAALCSDSDPSRLAAEYAAPDGAHPSINGEKCLARAMADALVRLLP